MKIKAISTSRSIYTRYKFGASKRNLDFYLTYEEFLDLTSKPCYYCGDINSNTTNNRLKTDTFKYNGIDRVDSQQGYFISNCVPCCKRCNSMKSDMDINSFYEQIKKIYEIKLRRKL